MDEINEKELSVVSAEEAKGGHQGEGKKPRRAGIADSHGHQETAACSEKGHKEGVEINEVEEDLEGVLEKKEKELASLHDRLLRTQAEFENYKKRMSREKASMLKFGNESLMREILPIIDNLELSLGHASKVKSIDSMIEGIEMVKKELLKKLEKFGLKMVVAKGEKFDPEKHEAVAQVETAESPEGTVVDELQKGYSIHDRLLRPSKVTVAKAPSS